jgi:Flp pilus assembly protein TadG
MKKARTTFCAALRDTGGQTLIMFTLMIPVIMGFIGLALEGGQFLMLHSQLQDLADASALAGAKQLDGHNGAINDAIQAAENFSNNNTPWWSNVTFSGQYEIQTPQVYKSLNPLVAADTDLDAAYIKVTTVSRSVIPAFLVAIGATTTNSTTATATAESETVACSVQPLMLCNPSEPNSFNPPVGQLYGFTQQGTGSSPGDFSLLDPAGQTNSTATQIRNLLSKTNPSFCYVDNISPRPGQATQSIQDGINVRFDIQPNSNNQISGLDQTPDVNVIKGELPGNNCNWQSSRINYLYGNTPNAYPSPAPSNPCYADLGSPSTTVGFEMSFPCDTDLARPTGQNTWIGNTMDMNWAADYWQYHHGNANWPTCGTSPCTRYQAYQQELSMASSSWTGQETSSATPGPAPVCKAPGSTNRRLFSVAIVNCQAQNVTGNSSTDVRSNSYAQFFLIRPVGSAGIIWAEFVQMITAQSTGTAKLHQIVQLVSDQ